MTEDSVVDPTMAYGVKTKKPPYSSTRYLLTPAELERMRRMEHYRPISKDWVRQLFLELEGGNALKGVFVVNDISTDRGKRYRLIDGNHRWEAIAQHMEKHPDAKIWIDMHIYDHLSPDQERKVFVETNAHRAQRQRDILNLYQDQLPIWAMIQKKFPCSVFMYPAGGSTGVSFTPLVKAYLNRFNVYVSAHDNKGLIDHVKGLDKTDYEQLVQFVDDMIECFQKPDPTNIYFKAGPFAAVTKVYFCNLRRLTRTEVLKRLKTKVYQDSLVGQLIASGARSMTAVKGLTHAMVEAANKGYTVQQNLFVTAEQYNVEHATQRAKGGDK